MSVYLVEEFKPWDLRCETDNRGCQQNRHYRTTLLRAPIQRNQKRS